MTDFAEDPDQHDGADAIELRAEESAPNAAPAPVTPAQAASAVAAAAANGRPDQHAGGELVVPDGYQVLEGQPDGFRRAVGVVVARFNGAITSALLASCLAELESAGVSRDATASRADCRSRLGITRGCPVRWVCRSACIVALGCVIRGETAHFDFVASEAASGLQLASIETGVPVAFGVLTTDTVEQAIDRAGTKSGNKGADAALCALELANLLRRLES